MKKINRTGFLSILLVLTYLLNACSGAPAGQNSISNSNTNQSSDNQVQEVVFTGTVDTIGAGAWTVSGQTIQVDSAAAVSANIVVGDNVKVEAQVAPDGSVKAVKIEISGADDANANTNSGNANDNTSNSNDNQADNSNAVNANANGNDSTASAGNEQEVTGVIEAITTDSITINGVTYTITNATEFKDLIAMGDQVKVHVIANADGTFTIREIEKSAGTGLDNGNSNGNGSDDNSNTNSNTNGDDSGGNGNDGNSNDSGGGNGNDDGGGGNGNDDSGGGNGNGNG